MKGQYIVVLTWYADRYIFVVRSQSLSVLILSFIFGHYSVNETERCERLCSEQSTTRLLDYVRIQLSHFSSDNTFFCLCVTRSDLAE